MNINVNNIAPATDHATLRKAFEAFGTVSEVKIINSAFVQGCNFGFIKMPNEAQAKAAIAALNSKEIDGFQIQVSVATWDWPKDLPTSF